MVAQGRRVGDINVQQDNMSIIAFVNKGKFTSHRTKHITERYFFIKVKIDGEEMDMEYTPTLQMLAETFTKPLQGQRFRVMGTRVLGCYVIYCIEHIQL